MTDVDPTPDDELRLREELHRSLVPPPTPPSLVEAVDAMAVDHLVRPERAPSGSWRNVLTLGNGPLRVGAGVVAVVAVVVVALVVVSDLRGLGSIGTAPSATPPAAAESALPSPSDPASMPPLDAGLMRYACGRFPFGAELLEARRTDEEADTPIAAALRAHLARAEMDIDWLPDTGWTLVGEDAAGAEFVTVTGEADVMMVSVGRDGDGWEVDGWAGCQPARILPPGLGEASWVLAPGQSIDPGTTTFEALVTERDCASGRTSEGRIVGPDIRVVGDEVLVTFAVRPLFALGHTCPSNPATRIVVTLPEPLGERRLLDGSTLPPREPVPDP